MAALGNAARVGLRGSGPTRGCPEWAPATSRRCSRRGRCRTLDDGGNHSGAPAIHPASATSPAPPEPESAIPCFVQQRRARPRQRAAQAPPPPEHNERRCQPAANVKPFQHINAGGDRQPKQRSQKHQEHQRIHLPQKQHANPRGQRDDGSAKHIGACPSAAEYVVGRAGDGHNLGGSRQRKRTRPLREGRLVDWT